MRLAARAGLTAMELCWLYPWAMLLGVWVAPVSSQGLAAPLLSAASVLALLGLGQAVTRNVSRRGWPLRLSQLAVVGIGALTAFVLVALQYSLAPWLVPLFAYLFALFLWSRGIVHGRGRMEFDVVERAFGRGVVALVLYLLAAMTAPTAADLQGRAGLWVVGFFVAGLSSLALTRLEDVREESRARGLPAPALGRQWLPVTLAVVVGTLLLTLLVAQLLSFNLIGALAMPLLRVLFFVVGIVVLIIAIPLAILLALVVQALRALLPDRALEPLPAVEQAWSLDELRRAIERQELPPELLAAVQWLTIGMVVLVGLLLVARMVLWRQERERKPGDDEERDSVWSWSELAAIVRTWLSDLLARLFPRRVATASTAATISPTTPESPAALTVREVYRQLLALGASVGRPRGRHTTPREHLPALQDGLDPDDDLDELTRTYERARYGSSAPTDPEVDDARARLDRVRAGSEQPPTKGA